MLPTSVAPAADLQIDGFTRLGPDPVATMCGVDRAAISALADSWNALPPDLHLRDGGRYRSRRHGSFVVDAGVVTPVAHRAHWQPVAYNALHGGLLRWFEPLSPDVAASPGLLGIVGGLGRFFSSIRRESRWFVEVHQFRIDTQGGIGRPTPEGAHRDGVDFVAVVLVGRSGIKGGETRVFDANGPRGTRFTMDVPWSALLLDDTRVIHETTPIQPITPGGDGHRDTLVVTFRAGGFQDPDAARAP